MYLCNYLQELRRAIQSKATAHLPIVGGIHANSFGQVWVRDIPCGWEGGGLSCGRGVPRCGGMGTTPREQTD